MGSTTKHYLRFDDVTPPGRKTKIISVINSVYVITLGEIKWFGAWRKYCFFPGDELIFDRSCMLEIVDEINRLTTELIKTS